MPPRGNNIERDILPSTILTPPDGGDTRRLWVDSIIRVNAQTDTTEPVFVDRFAVTETLAEALDLGDGLPALATPDGTTTPFNEITLNSGDRYRIGMIMYAQSDDGAGNITDFLFNSEGEPGVEIICINNNTLTLAFEQSLSLATATVLKFVHKERVLNFDTTNIITNSASIVDDLLFWTDNNDEPKKINITRSIAGTIIPVQGLFASNTVIQTADSYLTDPKQTKLFVNNAQNELVPITSVENFDIGFPDYHFADIKKEHITVIRKKPTTPLSLTMSEFGRDGDLQFELEYPILDPNSNLLIGGFVNYNTEPLELDGIGDRDWETHS